MERFMRLNVVSAAFGQWVHLELALLPHACRHANRGN